MRFADVHVEIFKTQVTNGCFTQEQTVAKSGATSESRTDPTLELWQVPSPLLTFVCLVDTAIHRHLGFSPFLGHDAKPFRYPFP